MKIAVISFVLCVNSLIAVNLLPNNLLTSVCVRARICIYKLLVWALFCHATYRIFLMQKCVSLSNKGPSRPYVAWKFYSCILFLGLYECVSLYFLS